MAIITISKEFSSGGQALAYKLAASWAIAWLGRGVLAELAARLDMSEAEAELIRRGEDNYLFKLVDEVFLHTVRRIARGPRRPWTTTATSPRCRSSSGARHLRAT